MLNSGCTENGGALWSQNGGGYYGIADCDVTYHLARRDGQRFSVTSFAARRSLAQNWTGSAPVPPRDNPDGSFSGQFFDWAHSNAHDPGPQFFVSGLRDGAEIVRYSYYGTTDRSDFDLSGFENLDAIRFGQSVAGRIFADSFELLPNTPDTAHCFAACYTSTIYSMNATPVPGPAGLPLMLTGLGALGLAARRRIAA